MTTDPRPHSRACLSGKHDHGTNCHKNCPSCGGVEQLTAPVGPPSAQPNRDDLTYVPTTENVREAFGDSWDDYRMQLEAAFDRWLTTVKAEAWDEGYWQGINGYTGPGNPYSNRDNECTPPTQAELGLTP